jgi:23S rRNA pseudouridine1911/1915/1917 synthase|tara:strand:- start:869 stop:1846 length:978 start_codon:yes stop_codon:yes gene_type:complete
MKNIINLIVEKNSDKKRVDVFIISKCKQLSRTRIKNLILDDKLKINGKINQLVSKKINVGDKISIEIPEPKKTSLKPYNFKLDIVYQDSDLIVINKPAGISMHPGPGNYDNTVINALMSYEKIKLSNIGGELRPGIIHRIDKDTSGLVVIAKNNFSHENISKQFSDHSIDRIYNALVWGKLRPQSGIIETLITRSSKNRQLMNVSFAKGKKAITNYKTLKIFEGKNIPTMSLIECKLETGRTHQIRVHMNYKGNQIVGDKKYKKKYKKLKNVNHEIDTSILNLNRQFLHAKILGFIHPISGKKLFFQSNLPNELKKIINVLEKSN